MPNVSPIALACMIEMGFDIKEIHEALQVCRNNPMVACEWLCGDREGAIFEAETGFPRDSTIVQTLIENPHFQLGLESPKMFMGKNLIYTLNRIVNHSINVFSFSVHSLGLQVDRSMVSRRRDISKCDSYA